MNANANQVISMYSCARKVDMSKSIKLTCTQQKGFTLAQIAKYNQLAAYLRGK